MNAQVESRGPQQSHECWQGRLPTVALVGRDHGRGHASPLAQLLLAEVALDTGELEQGSGGGGDIKRLCHNTSVLPGSVLRTLRFLTKIADAASEVNQVPAGPAVRIRPMYSICATKKLLDRVGQPVGDAVAFPTTALGNWYATALSWRPQVAHFLSERTLVSVLVPLAPARNLGERFPAALAELLHYFGVADTFIASESGAMKEVGFARTQSRSLLGVMNQSRQYLDRARWLDDAPSLLHLSARPCYSPSRAQGQPMRCPDESLFEVLDQIGVGHGSNPASRSW